MGGGLRSMPHGSWPRTQEQEEALRHAFASIDIDGSGTIDATELKAVLRAMGHKATPAEVAELMSVMDADNSGTVDFEEFRRVMAAKVEDEEVDKAMEELLAVFQSLDTDATGSLSAKELQRGLKILGVKLTLEEVGILIGEIDKDGDGEISYDEFVDYVLNFDYRDSTGSLDASHHSGGGH